MSDLENANRLYEISVKLCAAIEKHKCLYDRNALRKNPPAECEIAWQSVAKECNLTIEYCKNRWKSLIKSFYQGIKRKGNRYYLHEYMDFLLQGQVNKSKAKRNIEAVLNDETNSTTNEESLSGSIVETINIEDEEDEGDSDSNTTSADESNGLSNVGEDKQQATGGIFIIDEIAEESGEADNRDRRLSYKRSCKRGLDAELLDELADEEQSQEPERKRVRKLVIDSRKKLSLQQEQQNDSTPVNNKQVQVRLDKIKVNPATIATKSKDNKTTNEVENMWSRKVKEAVKSSDSFYGQTQSSPPKQPKMVDRGTCTKLLCRNMATQYEVLTNPSDYDEIFMQTIRQQLKQMNARQKMNFKCKIYNSLLEVFDDTTDFPGPNEILKLPPKATPRMVNTTTGELRLMRELVSLVQAAKNTPEIINAKEKVKTAPVVPSQLTPLPAKLPVAVNDTNKVATTSPLSLSPSLDDDDDDLQFSIDNIDADDDAELPRTWEEIKAKPAECVKASNEESVMGLPRRVLQKVVRVSGSTGSTIVARDGDKKRIYRIYPKTINPNGLPMVANKNANIGTFYMSPAKVPNEVSTGTHRIPNNLANISIRPFNSMATNNLNNDSSKTGNNSLKQLNTIAANKTVANQSMFKNVHPDNRILSSTTGYFKMLPTPKTLASTTAPTTNTTNKISTAQTTQANSSPAHFNKITTMAAKNSMMPPTGNFSAKRPMTVRSHINAPQMIQRRYSICGPVSADKTNPTLQHTQSPVASKTSNSQTQPQSSSVQQIQISQPISLNTKAATTANNTKTQQNGSSSVNTATEADIKPSMKTLDDVKKPETKAPAMERAKAAAMQTEEIPILETAGTVGVDNLDPLFVKPPQIKSEPTDD